MFKKFINFFFEEEEEEVETEVEPEEKLSTEAAVPAKEEPVFYEVAHKPSTFIDLETTPKEPISPKRQEDRTERVESKERKISSAANKQPATEYVFTSVISPIFGSTEEANPSKPVTSVPKSSYNTSAAPVKESLLGTIISPIYGKVATPPAETVTANPVSGKEKDLPPLVELDELIEPEQNKVFEASEDEDLHQFTLFDVEQAQAPNDTDWKNKFGVSEFFDDTTN